MSAQRWDLKVPEENNGKTYWHRVGTMFANKSGEGFTIVIPPGVSISGKVCAFVPMSKDDYANQQRKAQGRPSRQEERGETGNDFGDDSDIEF